MNKKESQNDTSVVKFEEDSQYNYSSEIYQAHSVVEGVIPGRSGWEAKKGMMSMSSQSISDEYPVLQDSMNKYQALFVASNLALGMGPLILPNSFLQGGVLFSTVFLFIVTFFSYISSEYIVEVIGICNFINSPQSFNLMTEQNIQDNNNQQDNHPNDGKSPTKVKKTVREIKRIKKGFRMLQKFELSEIAGQLYGKEAQALMSMAIVMFLMGMTIAKSMAMARVISHMFTGIFILEQSLCWLGLIFLFSASFSFRNVSHMAWMQEYAALIRICVLYTLLLGIAYEIYVSGFKGLSFSPDYPLVNLSHIQSMFSNGVMAFLFHHSIPAFVKPITPQKDARWVQQVTFGFSFLLVLCLCLGSIAAFGTDIITFGEVKFMSESFLPRQPLLAYLAGVYIFLIVTAFPIMTITCRNTLMKLVVPHRIPLVSSDITIHTFSFTAGIIAIIAIIAALASNIQVVLNFIAGTIGVLILLVIPPLFVISGRNILRKKFNINYKLNRYVTVIKSEIFPYCQLGLGAVVFFVSTYSLTA